MENVKNNPEPKGQKFPCGSRVIIDKNLGNGMKHFSGPGLKATVMYVYAHAFGGDNIKSYSLDVDEIGESAWHEEVSLTLIEDE